jgi:hypothetical protein
MPAYILSEPYKQRVDNALATVEGMPSQQTTTLIPTRFETLQQPAGGKTFRICTFTGAWPINASKTVTARGGDQTFDAINLFAAVGNTASSVPKDCAIAKDGTQWYLIAAVCETAT